MQKLVVLINRTVIVVEPIKNLFKEMLPEVRVLNLVDESISEIMGKDGKVNERVVRRICHLAIMAEEVHADLCMSTCSSMVAAVDVAQRLVKVPFLNISQPMFERAIEKGRRIGLLATTHATVEPSANLLHEMAEKNGREIAVTTVLNKEAFSALLSGDVEKHEQLVLASVKELSGKVDVIVLAQATMADLESKAQKITDIPVLTSPRLAIEKIKMILDL
jgi:aspartate/glutamate racemase